MCRLGCRPKDAYLLSGLYPLYVFPVDKTIYPPPNGFHGMRITAVTSSIQKGIEVFEDLIIHSAGLRPARFEKLTRKDKA